MDSAGVIVQSADLTICYDERGTLLFINFLKYQHILYKYVTEVLVETYVFFLISTAVLYKSILQVQNMNYPSMF